MKDLYIEINETYDLNNNINFENEYVCINNGIIKGLKEGSFSFENLTINVVKENALSDSFELSYGRLSNKNLLVLGDSVSAQATIGNNKTYSTLLKEALNINILHNAAIGGTTLTYMYEGSNIDKEYHNHEVAIDGCRVVSRLAVDNKLKDFDYAIIAYGHNDQFFKPEVEQENTDINYLEQCKSYKASFRFIINTLRKHNPNIRIIVLNCTYSEYDIASVSPYGTKYNYLSYRNASKEIASEYKLKYIDPWDYMKPYSDYQTDKYYYQDCVHISPNGHKVLFEFLLNK